MNAEALIPKISILILTWNRKSELSYSLRSVLQQTLKEVEIIVVDSASSDGTEEMIRTSFPQVNYLRLPYNLGVIEGRNIGIANCKGELIFFLDDDAFLLELDALARIYEAFEEDPKIGVLFAKIVDLDGKIPSWVLPEGKKEFQDLELLTFTFIGAAHCIRRETFGDLGYMDPTYFRNGEENDLSLRIYGAGYYVLYYPSVVVLHSESQVMRNPAKQTEFYKFRNGLINYWKYLPIVDAALFTIWNIFIDFFRSIRSGYTIWYLWALIQMPVIIPITIINKRKPIPVDRLSLWYAVIINAVDRNRYANTVDWTSEGRLFNYIRAYPRRLLQGIKRGRQP